MRACRLTGRIATCNKYQAYAFVNIPLPPPPPPGSEPYDWWKAWGVYVISIGCALIVFGAISSYVIWRLKRYRTKYKKKKAELTELQERAQNLDEYAGGIGVADDEVRSACVRISRSSLFVNRCRSTWWRTRW